MRYSKYIAEQAFRTSATGERLFYSCGPWSRPFIVPDTDMERRLQKKLILMLRIQHGGGVIVSPFLFILRPEVLHQPYSFLGLIVVVTMVFLGVKRILFATILRDLQRASVRLGPRSFYGQMAKLHSRGALVLGFIASLLLVAAGVWMLSVGVSQEVAIAWAVLWGLWVAVFGLAAVVWGYTLYLKLQAGDSPYESEE